MSVSVIGSESKSWASGEAVSVSFSGANAITDTFLTSFSATNANRYVFDFICIYACNFIWCFCSLYFSSSFGTNQKVSISKTQNSNAKWL